MLIKLMRFGSTLISREAGREAFVSFQNDLASLKKDEVLKIDFTGILSFSPGWGDEFLTPLAEQFGERLVLRPSENLSVKGTLELLEKIKNRKFNA